MPAERPKNNQNPVPWLPEDSFWHGNSAALSDIFHELSKNYPEANVPKIDPTSEAPMQEEESWMFQKLLGHQHGTMEGAGSKLIIPRQEEYKYWPDFSRIHYGDHSFTVPSQLDTGKEYSKGFVQGGTQDENVDRLLAIIGYSPTNESVREVYFLAGQRLRGLWQAPGEGSARELLGVTARHSGVDMAELVKVSPFIKAELSKTGEAWAQPFPSEYEMCRLAVEAVFYKQIDWANYPVELTYDATANPQVYADGETTKSIPAREEMMATYILKGGRKVSVFNGKAVVRPHGIPRPTSDSQNKEAMDVITMQPGEHLVISSSVPHTRVAIDALTRILCMRGELVKSADIVTGKWLPWKELLAGMGEIPASHKADVRLRKVLAGKDPDS